MTNEMDAAAANRRKRKIKVRKRLPTIMEMIRSAAAGRIIFGAVAAVTAAYVIHGYLAIASQARSYGRIAISATPTEVDYVLGGDHIINRPDKVVHRDGDRTFEIAFGPDGRVRQVSCRQDRMALDICPTAYGTEAGMSELDIVERLGRPDRQAFASGRKVMTYAGSGYTFILEQGQLVQIVHNVPTWGLNLIRQLAWTLLP